MQQEMVINAGVSSFWLARTAAVAQGAREKSTSDSYSHAVGQFYEWAQCNDQRTDTPMARADAALLYIEARCGGDVGGMKAFSARSFGVALAALASIGIPELPRAARKGYMKIIRARETAAGGRRIHRARPMSSGEVLAAASRMTAAGAGAVSARNAAMVLLGFYGMMRPSDILALQAGDIEHSPDEVIIRYRQRKNWKQMGEFTAHLPARPLEGVFAELRSALVLWEALRREMPGRAYFCHCRAGVGRAVKSPEIVGAILREHADDARDVSGYSLRRGGVRARLEAGQAPAEIMKIGGWHNTDSFGLYGYV